MENNKNGDTVYVPFVLEVDYKVYEDGTHYALCRENGSTELVFKDLETAKKITEELHNSGYLGEYEIMKGLYNSGSHPCLSFGKIEVVYMSEYASKIDKIIEADNEKEKENNVKKIAENVKRFNEYPEIQEIQLSNGNIIKFVKSIKSGKYGSGKYSNLVLRFKSNDNEYDDFWFADLFKTNGKINTRNYNYRRLLFNIPKEELNKVLYEFRDKYNQISGLKLT